jgi:hypothetical protein
MLLLSKILLSVALFWFIGSSITHLQQAHASPGRQENPVPCLHKEREALDFLMGDWNVEANVRLGDGKWEHSSATSQIKPDLSGCLLSERFTGTRNGHAFTALALMAFNNTSKKLQRLWSDSEHGLLILYDGNRSENEIILETEILLDGRSVKLRNSYLEITGNSFNLESARSTDGGKTWITVTRLRYTRK